MLAITAHRRFCKNATATGRLSGGRGRQVPSLIFERPAAVHSRVQLPSRSPSPPLRTPLVPGAGSCRVCVSLLLPPPVQDGVRA